MALKAKYLRIDDWIRVGGNTLETYQTFTPRQVTIDILRQIQDENEERPHAELSMFMPITITNDILVNNCKFRMDSEFVFSATLPIGNGSEIELSYDGMFDAWDLTLKKEYKEFMTAQIQYLHELQAVYFWACRHELEIENLTLNS